MSESLYSVQSRNSKEVFVKRKKHAISHPPLKRKNTVGMKMTFFYFSNFVFLVLCLHSSADNLLGALDTVDQESYVEKKN